MSTALQTAWTRDEFLRWEGHQHARYEFDGAAPVAMTGGSYRHARIMRNLHGVLNRLLEGRECEALGPDAGVATLGSAIRYPDALVTCTRQRADTLTIASVVVAFEIISPGTTRIDRIVKVREYAAVASVRRYVIVESETVGLTVLSRGTSDEPWTADTLGAGEALAMPEIGAELPVDDIYAGVEFDGAPVGDGAGRIR